MQFFVDWFFRYCEQPTKKYNVDTVKSSRTREKLEIGQRKEETNMRTAE